MNLPFWPFYVGDYLADTMHLTTTEHGAYLLLLMAYWKKQGPLPDNPVDLAQITHLSLSDSLSDIPSPQKQLSHCNSIPCWTFIAKRLAPFFRIEGGMWHHDRLDRDIEKQTKRYLAMHQAAVKTNRKRWMSPSDSPPESPSVSEPEPEPEPESTKQERGREIPDLKTVLTYAQFQGIAPWKAEDWFNEMEGCGWLDFASRPIQDWQAVLRRVRVKWEADGRPMAPPSRTTSVAVNGVKSILDLKSVLQAKETLANEIKERWSSNSAMGLNWSNAEKRQEYISIRREIKELNSKLASMA